MKITLNKPTSGYNLAQINENFDRIEAEFQDKVLYRDNPVGEPNTLENDIDANGNSIYNLSNISSEEITLDGVPLSQVVADSAAVLRLDLAKNAATAFGAGQVGYGGTLNYVVGTIGAVVDDCLINVKLFPWLATGDGTTNDGPAIAAADTFARSKGHTLFFPRPAVAYRVLTFLELGSGSKWRGDNGSKILIDRQCSLGTSIGGRGRALYAQSKSDIRLEGLEFYSAGAALTTQVDICFNLVTKMRVRNCIFRDFGDATHYSQGLIVFNSTDVDIIHNTFTGNSGDGLAFSNSVINFNTLHNRFTNNGDWGFAISISCANGRVNGNYVANNDSTGLGADRSSTITFANNIVDDCEHGIRICDFGGTMGLSKNITATGNIILNCLTAGLSFENMDADPTSTATGNVVIGTTAGQGLRVVNTELGTIGGNTIVDSFAEAILFQSTQTPSSTGNTTVVGNTLDGATYGVRQITGPGTTTGITVAGNRVVNMSVTKYSLNALSDLLPDTLLVPGPIGSTTPSTGKFTTLEATSVITATGGQIQFPATQVPSSNANTLDDYEEGTWAVDPRINSSSTGIVVASSTTWYLKIGRLVTVHFDFTLSSKGVGSGPFTVAGLPFALDASGGRPGAHVACASGGSAMPSLCANYVSANSIIVASQSATVLTQLPSTSVTDTSRFYGTATYLTTN